MSKEIEPFEEGSFKRRESKAIAFGNWESKVIQGMAKANVHFSSLKLQTWNDIYNLFSILNDILYQTYDFVEHQVASVYRCLDQNS